VLRLPALDRSEASRPTVFPWKLVGHEDGLAASGRV